MSARILGVQHVSLSFPGTDESVAQARRFFGEILGLEERPVPPTLPGVILWFAAGDQELHVFSEPPEASLNEQSTRHPCFQVDDVVAFRRRLDDAGVTTIDNNGDIPGRPRFYARDPFGNAIEFVEFKPDHW